MKYKSILEQIKIRREQREVERQLQQHVNENLAKQEIDKMNFNRDSKGKFKGKAA